MFEEFVGVIIGLLWGAFGYATAKAKGNENFDAVKFFKTVLIGLILGLISEGIGVPVSEAEGLSVVGLLTIIVDKFVGLFYPSKSK